MADNTVLNPGVGGDTIMTEDAGNGAKIPVSKIRLGHQDNDFGDVSNSNPFPVGGAGIDELRQALQALLDQLTLGTMQVTQDLRTVLALDAYNRQVTTGSVLSGAAVDKTAAPTLMAGSDGKIVVTLLTDKTGRMVSASEAVETGPQPAIVSVIAGSDAGNITSAINTRTDGTVLVTDTALMGRLDVISAQLDQLILILSNAFGSSNNQGPLGSA
jgi:hypothetical protein